MAYVSYITDDINDDDELLALQGSSSPSRRPLLRRDP
jgi:hypothetical protein